MRLTLVLLVVAAAVVAGSADASVTAGGVKGNVVRTWTTNCPVSGCSSPAGGITLIALRRGHRVATTSTSESGTYRFVLRPGTYVVRSLRTSMAGSLAPRTVRVSRGRFTILNLELDAGVR